MDRSWNTAAPLALAVAVMLGAGMLPATAADDAAKIIADAARRRLLVLWEQENYPRRP